jgi:hypothetical protein
MSEEESKSEEGEVCSPKPESSPRTEGVGNPKAEPRANNEEVGVLGDRTRLDAETKEAVRSYCLHLFTLPAIALAILSFLLGYVFKTSNEATRETALAQGLQKVTTYAAEARFAQRESEQAMQNSESMLIKTRTILAQSDELKSRMESIVESSQALRNSQNVIEDVTKLLSKDKTLREEIAASAKQPDFDSNWFLLGTANKTHRFQLGFAGLPRHVTAYYKTRDGNIIPWGVNQYGCKNYVNGVILDFDESGVLYIRAPVSGSPYTVRNLYLGFYRNREDSDAQDLFNVDPVQFRVMVWE